MGIISFQCSKCNNSLRVSDDKAGKRAKCPNCAEVLTIPAGSDGPPPLPGKTPAVPGNQAGGPPPLPGDNPPGNQGITQKQKPAVRGVDEAAPVIPTSADDDEDEGGVYTLAEDQEKPPTMEETLKQGRKPLDDEDEDEDEYEDEDEDEEDDEDSTKSAEEQRKLREIRKRRRQEIMSLRKAPVDPEKWEKVQMGLVFVISGIGVWILVLILQKIPLITGAVFVNEYAYLAATELVDPMERPGAYDPVPLYRIRFFTGLLASSRGLELGLWLFRFSYIFVVIQLILTGIGYGMCLSVPDRYGTKALIITSMSIVGVNFLVTLFLQLLPMLGAYNYCMIPLLFPELGMASGNANRLIPLQYIWGVAPFWEGIAGLIFQVLTYAELVIFAIFLRAVALTIQDEKMEPPADALIRLGLGVIFCLLAFQLFINAGTSEVMIILLRIIYIIMTAFVLWLLIWLIQFSIFTRGRIERVIRGF